MITAVNGGCVRVVEWSPNAWWWLQLRAIELRKEELRLRRLANIARPLGIPELKPYQSLQGEHFHAILLFYSLIF